MAKKVLKYIALILGLLLLMIAGLLTYTQTASFRNVLRHQGLKILNPKLNGEINIGKIHGNIFNTLQLAGVSLVLEDSTVFSIDSISLKYHLADFFKKEIEIDSIMINEPEFYLWFLDSTTLNVNHIFENFNSSDKNNAPTFPIIIDVNNVILKNGLGFYQTGYGKSAIKLKQINLEAKGYFKDKHVEIDLNELEINVNNPDIVLKDCGFHFIKNGPQMVLDSFYLQTQYSDINLEAEYNGRDTFNLNLIGAPLHEEDFKKLLPGLPLRSIERLELLGQASNTGSNIQLKVEKSRKSVELFLKSGNVFELIRELKNPIGYNAEIKLKDFAPEEWFYIDSTNTEFNGLVKLQGADLFNYKDQLKLSARLNHSSYHRLVADTFNIDAIQNKNEIDAKLLFINDQTIVEGLFKVKDLYHVPIYHADVETSNLNIEAINSLVKKTIVNGNLIIDGRYIVSKDRQVKVEGKLNNSLLFDVPVDSITFVSNIDSEGIEADTFRVDQPGNTLFGSGEYNFRERTYSGQGLLMSNYFDLSERLGLPPVVYKSLLSDWHLKGSDTIINYDAEMSFSEAQLAGIESDTIVVKVDGDYGPDIMNVKGEIALRTIQNDFLRLDTLGVEFDYQQNQLYSNIDFEKTDTLTGHMNVFMNYGDTIALKFENSSVSTSDAQYYLPDTIQEIKLIDKSVWIENLQILDRKNDLFSLKADGYLSQDSTQAFELDVKSLDLGILNSFLSNNDSIKGQLFSNIKVDGRYDSLNINGKYLIEESGYKSIPIPTLKGGIKYVNGSLYLDTWVPSLDSSVFANAVVPLKLNLDSQKKQSVELSNDFKAGLYIDSLKISSPQVSEYQYLDAGGYLRGSILAEGQFTKPVFNGELVVDSGYVLNQKQGIYYKDINGIVSFKDSTISIDTLFVSSDKGYFASKGAMVFDSTIISGKLTSSNIETAIDGFHVVQHSDYDVNISGNPYYRSEADGNPRFGGKVRVNRSSFNLPGLIKTEGQSDNKDNVPLLLQATQQADTINLEIEDVQKGEISPLIKQLRGRLTIDIPRGTWLKGDDMNIEIAGDFDIAKNGDYFELFGDVEVVRGYYILYGRKFNIEKGVITFTGGEIPDPRLDITAEYTFRSSDKEKHILRLSVTSLVSKPEIAFTLDDDAISESDAVSIMIFGKTMDELSYVGQNGIIGSVGSNMLANMITSSLNSTIGQRLKLDMIEVNSTENWQSAAFVVGKYLTNDLFVIYQRGFGETEDDEITPETITLEYELSKLLFFRLQGGSSKTSGFDVILKFESSK